MSWEAQAWVWTLDGLTGLTKLVALSLANHAGPDGEHIRPSIQRVAEQTCASEKTVKRAIADLIERGMLALVDSSNGRGRTNEYSMPVDLQRVADRGTKKRGSSSDIETEKGGLCDPHFVERGTLSPIKGDSQSEKGGLCDPPILVQSLRETKKESKERNSLPLVGHDSVKNDLRGKRLAEDWIPADDCHDFAVALGLHPGRTLSKFKDYWLAKPGKDAVKLDWSRTWRNWCRSESERRGTAPAPAPQPNARRQPTPTIGSPWS